MPKRLGKEIIVGKENKDWSLYQRLDVIRLSWWGSFGDEPPWPYIHEIFDDYIIIKIKGKYAKVAYNFNDGDVTFSDPEEWASVEVEYKGMLSVVRRTVARPIRLVKGSDLEYECYGVLFGDHSKRDLEGTYFDADTKFHLDWHTQWPWLYHHGMNKHIQLDNVGTWKSAVVDETGAFFTGELNARHRYLEQVQDLLAEKALFPSSGTFSYMMKVADDGHILEWPIGELSSTVAPAEFRGNPISQRAASALKVLGGM